MGIEVKSLGVLIDELITTSMKCWYAQETVMKNEDSISVAIAASQAQELNARRNALIRAIDEKFGEGDITLTSKTYSK